jgi:glyoxylase-like metal-dependent hydrolase (beta-lactamase superfamily II)
VRIVLNTHWHGDHTGGNAVFGAQGTIIAHENVRKRLMAGAPARKVAGKDREATPPAAKEALPVVTFQDKLMVHLNGEDIRAIHLPGSHTDGDLVVWFTKSNVVHMGDAFVTYGFPFIDLGSGGTVKGFIAALDKMVGELPADVKIIPGHGGVSTLDDMKKLSGVLKDCVKIVEGEIRKRKTLKEMQEGKVLSKYEAMGKEFMSADVFIETLHQELTKKPAGR